MEAHTVRDTSSSQLKSNVSRGDVPFSGPLQVSSSSGFAWVKRRKDDSTSFLPRYHSRSISKSHIFNVFELPNSEKTNSTNFFSRGVCHDFFEDTTTKRKQRGPPFERPDSFDASDHEYHSQELSGDYQKEDLLANKHSRNFLASCHRKMKTRQHLFLFSSMFVYVD